MKFDDLKAVITFARRFGAVNWKLTRKNVVVYLADGKWFRISKQKLLQLEKGAK